MDEKHIIALEIGSSKIKGAVGSVDSNGYVTVKAIEEMPLTDSVRHGQLSNVSMAANAVRTLLLKIENRLTPRKVEGIYTSISGRSVAAIQRQTERRLPADTEVTDDIIEALKREMLGERVPDREVIDVVAREFYVNGAKSDMPVGMYGSEIRMSGNLIVCRPQLRRNLKLLIEEKLGLEKRGCVVKHLAMGDIVLTSEERQLGCMLVDFGAETVTVSIYRHGYLQYLQTIPMGSRNITRDLTRLNYVEEDAEALKRQRGNAKGAPAEGSVDDVKMTEFNNYVSHRAAEIIANIKEQISYAGLTPAELPAGIVIVGGGARLAEFNTLLGDTTKMKVRMGSIISPRIGIADSRISPAYSVDVVSILYAAAQAGAQECLSPEPVKEEPIEIIPEPEPVAEPERQSGFSKAINWLKRQIQEPPEDPDGCDLLDD